MYYLNTRDLATVYQAAGDWHQEAGDSHEAAGTVRQAAIWCGRRAGGIWSEKGMGSRVAAWVQQRSRLPGSEGRDITVKGSGADI